MRAREDRDYIYGHLCITQEDYGFVSYDPIADLFGLDRKKLRKHLRAVRHAGAKALRVFLWGVWGKHLYGRKGQFCPFKFDPSTNGWILAERPEDYRADYWAVLEGIVDEANSLGMKVILAVLNNCELHASEREFSPWSHNQAGLVGFDLYSQAADKFTEPLYREVFRRFSGKNTMIALGNENNDPAFVGYSERVSIRIIKEIGFPLDRIIVGPQMDPAPYLGDGVYGKAITVQDLVRERFERSFGEGKFLLTREVHGVGELPFDAARPFGANLAQALCWWTWRPEMTMGKYVGEAILSPDGTTNNDNPADGGRPTAQTMGQIVAYVLPLAWNFHFEYCPEGDEATAIAVFEAMSASHRAVLGVDPEGYHLYPPEVEPEPTPKPTPTPKPKTKKCKCRYWLEKGSDGKRDWRRWWDCVFGDGPKHCK
jgi:hypothetical protein